MGKSYVETPVPTTSPDCARMNLRHRDKPVHPGSLPFSDGGMNSAARHSDSPPDGNRYANGVVLCQPGANPPDPGRWVPGDGPAAASELGVAANAAVLPQHLGPVAGDRAAIRTGPAAADVP